MRCGGKAKPSASHTVTIYNPNSEFLFIIPH